MSTLQTLTDDADTVDSESVGTALSLIDTISDQRVPIDTVNSGLTTISNLLCSLKLEQRTTGDS